MRVSKVALRALTPVVALVLAVAAATPTAPALARSGAIAAPAAVVAADPPETAAVPQSSPAQRECSTPWRDVGSLRAVMCITPHPGNQYQVTAWVRNRSATQHTVAVWLYFRVGLDWARGRNFYRGGCGKSVEPNLGQTVRCDTPIQTIIGPEWRWKWGIARVHDVQDDTALNMWNIHPLP
jgi:hypothetical protein